MAYMNITLKDKRTMRRFVKIKFSRMDPSEVGLTNLIKHEISIRKDSNPWREEPCQSNLEILNHEIDRLLDKGYIKKGNNDSEWSSQARMVKNKDGNWIFHVNYTKLNSCLLNSDYPIHSQWDMLEKLNKAYIISMIKIKEIFHQIELKPESRKYTSFEVTGRGVYMWARIPYGLKGASASVCYVEDQTRETVSKRMKSLYPNIPVDDKIFVCLETWIVISEKLMEHHILLNCLLDVLYENGLEIDIEKSQIAKESIDYFSFTIDYDGLHISQESIQPIIDYPRPKNIQEVRRFNGMVHHYRNHLKNIAMIQRPLNKFCAPQAVWRWTMEEETSFQETKLNFFCDDSLSMLNPSLPFRLYTYVTREGLGAKLVQYEQRTDREYLITYVSKNFTEAQCNYPLIVQKILSVVSTLSHVTDIIKKCKCEVVTSPSVLSWYKSKETIPYKLDRWATILSKYNITLKSYLVENDEVLPKLLE